MNARGVYQAAISALVHAAEDAGMASARVLHDVRDALGLAEVDPRDADDEEA